MTNELLLISMLLGFAEKSMAITQVLKTAKEQGRDVTGEELDALFGQDSAARAALQVIIDTK